MKSRERRWRLPRRSASTPTPTSSSRRSTAANDRRQRPRGALLMLEDADLDTAAAEAIISPAQVAALRELAARRERDRAIAQGHEERFRFMRGFNDIFFSVGVVLFV